MSNYAANLRNVRAAAAVLDELKVRAGCVDCGFNAWPEALHFDHVDPSTKQRSLGWVPDRSKLTSKNGLRRFLEHVSKCCEVRCANCHAHRTKVSGHYFIAREGSAAVNDAPALF